MSLILLKSNLLITVFYLFIHCYFKTEVVIAIVIKIATVNVIEIVVVNEIENAIINAIYLFSYSICIFKIVIT